MAEKQEELDEYGYSVTTKPDASEQDGKTPVGRREAVSTIVAVCLAALLFSASSFRTGIGMANRTPAESKLILGVIFVIGIGVFLFSVNALRITRGHDGTIIRGVALASVILSALSLMFLGNSEIALLGAR